MSNNTVVLAFSGGLDTSFCVPYLIEQGYQVHTLFVNTGGVSNTKELSIKQRAYQLGATKHYTVDGKESLWQQIVVPMVWANTLYQDQYPALCADRYLIVQEAIKLCQQLGTSKISHGCTGMGNDQVRFDLSVQSLGDFEILSPIREIQKTQTNTRDYEIQYLEDRGFDVSDEQNKYSINENLLGVTISGSEIDQWKAPSLDTHVLTKSALDAEKEPLSINLTFVHGEVTAIDNKAVQGANILQQLNIIGGNFGIGRGIYTGDTIIGLKGRIVFEAPGLKLLQCAHKALEETVLTSKQNNFKPVVAKEWMDLIYKGFYFEPLYQNTYLFLNDIQQAVNGTVTLQLTAGQVLAVAVNSQEMLISQDATYAQTASWGIDEAMGFINLYGKSSSTWATIQNKKQASNSSSTFHTNKGGKTDECHQ